MSYDEEEVREEHGFKLDGDEDADTEELEPQEEGALNDFRFDEDTDDDPDSRYH